MLTSFHSVAKQIAPSDANQDLDLNADLFIMFGVGPTGTGAAALSAHNFGSGNPIILSSRINPVVVGGPTAPVSYVDNILYS